MPEIIHRFVEQYFLTRVNEQTFLDFLKHVTSEEQLDQLNPFTVQTCMDYTMARFIDCNQQIELENTLAELTPQQKGILLGLAGSYAYGFYREEQFHIPDQVQALAEEFEKQGATEEKELFLSAVKHFNPNMIVHQSTGEITLPIEPNLRQEVRTILFEQKREKFQQEEIIYSL